MKKYCLGFIFSPQLDQVYLITKKSPPWQAGFWNGLGGKLETGESPLAAMRREAREEAGHDSDTWRYLGRMCAEGGEAFECAVYFDRLAPGAQPPETRTEEAIVRVAVDQTPALRHKMLKNVPCLVLACLARLAGQEFELDFKYAREDGGPANPAG